MDARVPADHPLRVLARASTEPLEATIARLLALDTGLTRLTLLRALRAALLQSFYGIADDSNFADQVHFNALFRWFIGLENIDQPWDSAAYVELHKRWTSDQELRQFLELVVTNAGAWTPLKQRRS
jgi:transposase